MAKQRTNSAKSSNGANLGFEEKLWAAADKLRGHMDASEYKHVVLGLIFLKYISDAFEERHAELQKEKHADPEDRDEYAGANVFWVPKKARWPHLQANAKQAEIGKIIDEAMLAIEKDNPQLKGVLSKDYARPALDKQRLGELIDLVGTIGLGDKENRSKDILGRVYEYFLGQFASAEGKKGGEFYTLAGAIRAYPVSLGRPSREGPLSTPAALFAHDGGVKSPRARCNQGRLASSAFWMAHDAYKSSHVLTAPTKP